MRTANWAGFAHLRSSWNCMHSPAREYTSGVEVPLLRGPFAAQVGLGWPAVSPTAIVESAGDTIIIQVPAGRDHLSLDGEVSCPFHLAEIRRAAGTHQGLQLALAFGAHDLDLQVSAAGSTTEVIGSPAGGHCAGIAGTQHRQAARGRWKLANGPSAILDNEEAIAVEATRLGPFSRTPRSPAGKAVSCALSLGSVPTQVAAGYVKHSVHVQFALVLPEIVKADVLGVSQKPGGLVIEGGCALLQRSDSKSHRHTSTLRPNAAARRWAVTARVVVGLNRTAHGMPRGKGSSRTE
jgi:hypothetical protein